MSLNGTAAIIVPIYEGLVKEIKSFLIHLTLQVYLNWNWAPYGINDYDNFFFVAMKIFANPNNRSAEHGSYLQQSN